MSRPTHRGNSKPFNLFSNHTTFGWRVVSHVSLAEGDSRVASGVWVRVYDQAGKLAGFQPLDASPSDEQLPSQNSNPCISTGEMQANAGVCFARGKSRTAQMPEVKRLQRRHPLTGRLLAAEDFIERSVEKVKLWTQPAPGRGDRAVRVYPKGESA